MAIAALVLGIASWVMCGPFFSIPGLIIGKMEMGNIARGTSSPAGATLAKVGFWLSVVNLCFVVIGVCIYAAFMLFFVGALGSAGASQSF